MYLCLRARYRFTAALGTWFQQAGILRKQVQRTKSKKVDTHARPELLSLRAMSNEDLNGEELCAARSRLLEELQALPVSLCHRSMEVHASPKLVPVPKPAASYAGTEPEMLRGRAAAAGEEGRAPFQSRALEQAGKLSHGAQGYTGGRGCAGTVSVLSSGLFRATMARWKRPRLTSGKCFTGTKRLAAWHADSSKKLGCSASPFQTIADVSFVQPCV